MSHMHNGVFILYTVSEGDTLHSQQPLYLWSGDREGEGFIK